MIIRAFCLFVVLTLVIACSSSKNSRTSLGVAKEFAASTPKSTDDGLSFATAIVITEKTSGAGIRAEYEWIKAHYTDYKIQGQSLNIKNDKPYDIITITLSNGKNLDLYFDISNFFGKF